jgi:hypothetical protein
MITKAQHGRHNTEWKLVCEEFGWKPNDDVHRLAFYREFRLPESRKDWSPRNDFDRFLKACLKIRGVKDTRDRERERLVWRIRFDARAAGLEEAYLKKLSTDLTGLGCWDELSIPDLTNFRNAIHNRAQGKTKNENTNPF